jgi:hypothetical protein
MQSHYYFSTYQTPPRPNRFQNKCAGARSGPSVLGRDRSGVFDLLSPKTPRVPHPCAFFAQGWEPRMPAALAFDVFLEGHHASCSGCGTRTLKSTIRACQVYFSRHSTSPKVDISSTAQLLDSIDPSKSPHEESITYRKIFLQIEMFELEHSSDPPAEFPEARSPELPDEPHPSITPSRRPQR